MQRIFLMCLLCTLITACTTGRIREAAIPLGNDMMEIDVSASSHYGRAGAMEEALKKAAQSTVDDGFDKFIVLNDTGWNESTLAGASYGSANANAYGGQANQGAFIGTSRHPEVKMVIRMFHDGDKGSEKAVDARAVLKPAKGED